MSNNLYILFFEYILLTPMPKENIPSPCRVNLRRIREGLGNWTTDCTFLGLQGNVQWIDRALQFFIGRQFLYFP